MVYVGAFFCCLAVLLVPRDCLIVFLDQDLMIVFFDFFWLLECRALANKMLTTFCFRGQNPQNQKNYRNSQEEGLLGFTLFVKDWTALLEPLVLELSHLVKRHNLFSMWLKNGRPIANGIYSNSELPNGKFPLLPDTFYISDTQPLSPVRSKITCWILFNGQWLHIHVW